MLLKFVDIQLVDKNLPAFTRRIEWCLLIEDGRVMMFAGQLSRSTRHPNKNLIVLVRFFDKTSSARTQQMDECVLVRWKNESVSQICWHESHAHTERSSKKLVRQTSELAGLYTLCKIYPTVHQNATVYCAVNLIRRVHCASPSSLLCLQLCLLLVSQAPWI